MFSIAALAVCAAWALSPMWVARVAHAEQPGEIELSITLANDRDGIVQAGDRVQVRAELRFLVEPEDRDGDGIYEIITHNELLLGQPLDSGRSWLRLSGGYAWDGSDSDASFQEQLQLNLSDEAAVGSDLAAVDARDLEDSTVATDGETIVFGAPNATVDGLAAAGAVYVLDRDGELLARLTSPNAAADARFGAAVAVDGQTIVVGAPQEPTRYNNAAAVATVGREQVSHGGAVYVFERPSRGWKSNSSPVATIVGHVNESRALPAARHDEVFARLRVGSSVAIEGDLLVVGVPGFSAYRVRSGGIAYAERDGAAFIFTRPSGGWTHASTADATAVLVAQDGAADDELGASVDIAPGGGSIVAGAPGEGDGVGAAYLFIRPNSGWSGIGSLIGGASAVKLVADAENDGAGFGSSVAVEDNTVVVAAPRADYQLRSAHGVAYVFRRPSAGWTQLDETDVANSETSQSGVLGRSSPGEKGIEWAKRVDISGTRILVAGEAGAVQLFERSSRVWSGRLRPTRSIRETRTLNGQAHGDGTTCSQGALSGELLVASICNSGRTLGYAVDLSGTQRYYLHCLSIPSAGGKEAVATCVVSTSSTGPSAAQNAGGDRAAILRAFNALALPTVVIPEATVDSEFTISAQFVTDDGGPIVGSYRVSDSSGGGSRTQTVTGAAQVSASLQVEVAQVDEVNTVTFAPAVAGNDSIDSGGEAELVLSVLNDVGSGSDPLSLLSIVLVTTGGSLTAPVRGVDCAITCVLFENDLERLRGIGDGTAGRISFTLQATEEAGAATVQARVISSLGELFEPPTLAFTFTGEQQRLALGPAPNSLLYRAAAGDGDQIQIDVTAVNASGQPTIPTTDLTVRITGPGGAEITAGDIRRSVVREGSRRYVQLETTATRVLATGRYTLRVSRGASAATQTFIVAGEATRISLRSAAGSDVATGEIVSLTATLTDRDGQPAPDTDVSFEVRTVGGSPALISAQSSARSRAGTARITYFAAGAGQTIVRAVAGRASGTAVLNVDANGQASEVSLGGLTSTAPASFAAWTGSEPIRASTLLGRLSGVRALLLLSGDAWTGFGVAGGQIIPGSANFSARYGDILWLVE